MAASSLPDASTDPALRRLTSAQRPLLAKAQRRSRRGARHGPRGATACRMLARLASGRARCRSRPLRAVRSLGLPALGALRVARAGDDGRGRLQSIGLPVTAVPRPSRQLRADTAALDGCQRAEPGAAQHPRQRPACWPKRTCCARASCCRHSRQPGTSLTARARASVVKRRLPARTVGVLVQRGHRQTAQGHPLTVDSAGQVKVLGGANSTVLATIPSDAAPPPPLRRRRGHRRTAGQQPEPASHAPADDRPGARRSGRGVSAGHDRHRRRNGRWNGRRTIGGIAHAVARCRDRRVHGRRDDHAAAAADRPGADPAARSQRRRRSRRAASSGRRHRCCASSASTSRPRASTLLTRSNPRTTVPARLGRACSVPAAARCWTARTTASRSRPRSTASSPRRRSTCRCTSTWPRSRPSASCPASARSRTTRSRCSRPTRASSRRCSSASTTR